MKRLDAFSPFSQYYSDLGISGKSKSDRLDFMMIFLI